MRLQENGQIWSRSTELLTGPCTCGTQFGPLYQLVQDVRVFDRARANERLSGHPWLSEVQSAHSHLLPGRRYTFMVLSLDTVDSALQILSDDIDHFGHQ